MSKTTNASLVVLSPEQARGFDWMVRYLSAGSTDSFEILERGIPNSVERIMPAPRIAALVKAVGVEKIRKFLSALLVKLIARVNVAHSMETQQKNFTIDTILERYPNDSLADFILCFKRGAQGYYGSSYHQLDTSVIMGWLGAHFIEKAYYLERDNTNSKKAEKDAKVDYDAFRERLERERQKESQAQAAAIEARRKEAKEFMEGTVWSPTMEQIQAKENHRLYLLAKWKHDMDPRNKGKDFIEEDVWIELQKPTE